MINYIYSMIFISFPEAIIVFLIGLYLCNVKVNYSNILGIATIQSIVALIVRVLNVPLGVHSLVQVLSMYILAIIFLKIEYYRAIIPVLIGFFFESVIQITVISIFSLIWNIDITRINTDFKLSFLIFIPVFFISAITIRLIKKLNFILCQI